MTMTNAEQRTTGWRADDSTFGARLALIRQKMAWGNMTVAAVECGLPAESWRTWERDNVMPRDVVKISRVIARRTGCDFGWLLAGSELQGSGNGGGHERHPILQSVSPPERTRPNGHPRQKAPHRGSKKSASERTVGERKRMLRQADRELPFGLDAALEAEVEDWIWCDGRSGVAPAPNTRAAKYSTLIGFYGWAVDHAGVLTSNPTTGIERPKVPEGVPRVAKDEHVKFIMTQAPQPYRLWGTLAGYAGLRCIEISRLQRQHVTRDKLHVVKGKGNKPGLVPMHPVVWDAVKDLPDGPITPVNERKLSNTFFRYCQRRGMQEMSLHRMRGWYASHSYRHSKDLMAVKANMRHSHPNTTARYIELDDDQLHAVIDGLPVFG